MTNGIINQAGNVLFFMGSLIWSTSDFIKGLKIFLEMAVDVTVILSFACFLIINRKKLINGLRSILSNCPEDKEEKG